MLALPKILTHGFHSDVNNFMEIGPRWKQVLPGPSGHEKTCINLAIRNSLWEGFHAEGTVLSVLYDFKRQCFVLSFKYEASKATE